ncbi:hypothetical protein ABZZ20_19210 [Streptomyces sp. NPDC006430]|uniref:hypothetical protein n=1 Tax=Streptomyces sp. NPDC006430 TaxID=3154299 RepID=UPI00339F26AF
MKGITVLAVLGAVWFCCVNPSRRSLLRLHFDKPELLLPGDTLDKLSIGIDGKRTFVYDDRDPDVCPDFRLRLQQN